MGNSKRSKANGKKAVNNALEADEEQNFDGRTDTEAENHRVQPKRSSSSKRETKVAKRSKSKASKQQMSSMENSESEEQIDQVEIDSKEGEIDEREHNFVTAQLENDNQTLVNFSEESEAIGVMEVNADETQFCYEDEDEQESQEETEQESSQRS